jgi:hypothetical protein
MEWNGCSAGAEWATIAQVIRAKFVESLSDARQSVKSTLAMYYYGYRTNDGTWPMFDSQRFVPVISPVQGWQYPAAVPNFEPLWKMQAASIAAEQIQELSDEVERLRQQLSSAQRTVDVERLVEVLVAIVRSVDLRHGDQSLVDAYRAGLVEYRDGDSPDERPAFRALVLAALGMEVHRGEQEAPTTATC